MSIEEDLWTLIRQKRKRIAKFEEENAKLHEQLDIKIWEVEELMHERKRLENDYMQLSEQLKNALEDIQNFIERKITASKKASQQYIDGYCACGSDVNDYIEDEVKTKYLEERK